MELVSPNTPRQKVIVVMPAYNAAKTLRITYDAMPMENVDHVILVDDGSHDETLKIAKELKLEVFVHARNFGYGANQKTCYTEALKAGADIVVMLHPDYQYDPTLLPKVIAPIKAGNADVVLGSRLLQRHVVAQGMPWWKFLGNRWLTWFENRVLGLDLAEYHTGYRAYSRQVLEAVPFQDLSTVGTIAGMILGQIQPQYSVLEPGQPAITQEFPPRHALSHDVPLQQSRSQHNICMPCFDGSDDLRQQRRIILVVRMKD